MNFHVSSLLLIACSASAQQGQAGAVVTSSRLQTVQLANVTNALPLGPVVAPIHAAASQGPVIAESAVTPATAASPLQIRVGASAPATNPYSLATASLGVDLLVSSPVPGPQWLRVLMTGGAAGNAGGHSWTLDAVPPGFHWTETRNSLLGHPLYLDVPVDLSQPASFRFTWGAQASGQVSCHFSCVFYSGSGGGTMDFVVRQEPPVLAVAYGVPCPTNRGTLPIAVAYDPYAVPGLTAVEALLVGNETPYRPVVLCIGASRDWLGPVPLPLDLTPLGAPGCLLLQDLVVTVPATLSVSSFAALPLASAATLRGLGPIYFQWLVVDPSNALGLVASNGVQVVVP
jgi:hypothetical protein